MHITGREHAPSARNMTHPQIGLVVQLVRTLACHARGRGFEPHPGRQFASIAQSAERILGKDEVTSSNLVKSSKVLELERFSVAGRRENRSFSLPWALDFCIV